MRTIHVSEEVSFVAPPPQGAEPPPSAGDREVARAPGSDADPGDAPTPPGMVLRYCGVTQEFYYAGPADPFCWCGHKIGGV